MTIWLTGLPSSGKTTLARSAAEIISGPAQVLDGDEVRRHLFPELGYSHRDRDRNVERIGRLAVMLASHGVTVFVAAIAPYREARAEVRRRHDERGLRYAEVWVDTPLSVCMWRDVKGLYARAADGELADLTGVGGTYEQPLAPELRVATVGRTVGSGAAEVAALADAPFPSRW